MHPNTSMKDDITQTSVKIPTHLLERIQRIADREHRSRNAQIVFFLDQITSQWDATTESKDYPNGN